MPRKIIIDCDPGIDDAVALTLALFDPRLEVVAVTAVAGNVPAERATLNVQAIIERLDPPRALLRQAIDAGCLFAVDTDAHAVDQLSWQPFGVARAAEVGIPHDRVVNTWPLERLLAWTAEHRAS